eukprot:gb/GEZJ01007025.1/.p1 GENE.gb/GEZJ01007025.1/~~gb/GEZJ01007025.1/.p1  ORF type:complete len:101 (+),score=7.52 gb/GEZJ01007025.1/:304-606(+)
MNKSAEQRTRNSKQLCFQKHPIGNQWKSVSARRLCRMRTQTDRQPGSAMAAASCSGSCPRIKAPRSAGRGSKVLAAQDRDDEAVLTETRSPGIVEAGAFQ